MWQTIERLIADQSGVTSIEYAVIASMLSIAVITTITLVGSNLSGSFANIGAAIASTIG